MQCQIESKQNAALLPKSQRTDKIAIETVLDVLSRLWMKTMKLASFNIEPPQ